MTREKQKPAGMQLMLVEMIFAIGFFAVIAAVCVSLFAGAWQTAAKSREQTGAILAAQSAAECFKYAGGDLDMAAGYLGADVTESGILTLCYDSDWEISDDDAAYRLEMSAKREENGLLTANISVTDKKAGVLFTLTAATCGEVLP